MGQKEIIINSSETNTRFNIEIKKPSLRYLSEFIKCKCAPDLLVRKLFPNAKEITESFAAFNAIRKTLNPKVFGESHSCIVVGDGNTPRTGAMFAMRTKWEVHSIDPRLKKEDWEVERLFCWPFKIEEFKTSLRLPEDPLVINFIILVHSHADISEFWDSIIPPKVLVEIPCCAPQKLENPNIEYTDWSIHSPQRTVRIWKEGV